MISGNSKSNSTNIEFGNRSAFTANDFIEVPDTEYHQPSEKQIKSVNMAFEH